MAARGRTRNDYRLRVDANKHTTISWDPSSSEHRKMWTSGLGSPTVRCNLPSLPGEHCDPISGSIMTNTIQWSCLGELLENELRFIHIESCIIEEFRLHFSDLLDLEADGPPEFFRKRTEFELVTYRSSESFLNPATDEWVMGIKQYRGFSWVHGEHGNAMMCMCILRGIRVETGADNGWNVQSELSICIVKPKENNNNGHKPYYIVPLKLTTERGVCPAPDTAVCGASGGARRIEESGSCGDRGRSGAIITVLPGEDRNINGKRSISRTRRTGRTEHAENEARARGCGKMRSGSKTEAKKGNEGAKGELEERGSRGVRTSYRREWEEHGESGCRASRLPSPDS
ncbi:hypothetical protein B0H11DRAFT_1926574 [Mycena galericulata]|nr:hypothetical protein B0H11DRAFT_1926574 [Mycena galericulata]